MKENPKRLSVLLGPVVLACLLVGGAVGGDEIDAVRKDIQKLTGRIETEERTIREMTTRREEMQFEVDRSSKLREDYEERTSGLRAADAEIKGLEKENLDVGEFFAFWPRLFRTRNRVELSRRLRRRWDYTMAIGRWIDERAKIDRELRTQGVDIEVGEVSIRERFDDLDAFERELKRRDQGVLDAELKRIDRSLADLAAERSSMMEQMSELDRRLARLQRRPVEPEEDDRIVKRSKRPAPPPDKPPIGGMRAGSGKLEWFKPQARHLKGGLKIAECLGDEVVVSVRYDLEKEGICRLAFDVEGRGRCLCYCKLPKGGRKSGIYTHVPLPVGTFTVTVRVLEAPGIPPLKVQLTRRPYDEQGNGRKLETKLADVDKWRQKLGAANARTATSCRRYLCQSYAGVAAALNQLGHHEEALRACEDGLRYAGQAAEPASIRWNAICKEKATAALYLHEAALLKEAVERMVWYWELRKAYDRGHDSIHALQARRLAQLAEELMILGEDPSTAREVYRRAMAIDSSEGLSESSNFLRSGQR
jgi:hypothetical protein